MTRRRMTIDDIRNEQRDRYGDETDRMGIMALVDVEDMGFCKDGTTRWYHFADMEGQPAVYFKY